jgi:phosphoribosylformimino-5-aminoimidazole carboxamide ribotide isomerase
MHIIPVIDILNGRAVHAYRGRRDDYRPLQSRLCPGPDPLELVRGFLELYPFPVVYLADLDAITGSGGNDYLLRQLPRRFPGLEFWIDRGGTGAQPDYGPAVAPVLGAETGLSVQQLRQAGRDRPDLVLSLDFDGNGFMGDRELLEDDAAWPPRCIVMTLERVGSAGGPDLERLAALRRRAPGHEYFLAGGVRDRDDLARARDAGAAGVLLASALHDGTITRETLDVFCQR